MRKSDVETYYDRGGRYLPSVNVKVNNAWQWYKYAYHVARSEGDARPDDATRFAEWCERHAEDEKLEWLFEAECESGWESASCDLDNVWGYGNGLKVEGRGRSGGHLVVIGLPDIDEWDAIALGRWARYAKWQRLNADDVPYQMAWQAYFNVWEPLEAERAESELPIMGGV
jgi:hypothetical protein